MEQPMDRDDLLAFEPLAYEYVPKSHRRLCVEEVFRERLENDALPAVRDFFSLLHQPLILMSMAQHLVHTEVHRMKNGGSDGGSGPYRLWSAQEHAEYIFHVLAVEALHFEIVHYTTREPIFYLFGETHPAFGFPLSAFSKTPEMNTAVLRMCAAPQLNAHSVVSHAPDHSARSSAFSHVIANRSRNCVTYSNFNFNALFDLKLPRAALIAAYCLSFLTHARAVDIGEYEKVGLRRSSSGNNIERASPSSTNSNPSSPLRASSLSAGGSARSLHSSTNSLTALLHDTDEVPTYVRTQTVLRSALRRTFEPEMSPTARRRALRVLRGSRADGNVRAVEVAPADEERERRAQFLFKSCAPLLAKLDAAKSGELVSIYDEILVLINQSMSLLVQLQPMPRSK